PRSQGLSHAQCVQHCAPGLFPSAPDSRWLFLAVVLQDVGALAGGVQVHVTLDFRFVPFSAWLDGWFVGNLKPRPHFPGLVGEADGAAVDGLGADALAASAALAARPRAARPREQGA